MEISISSAIRSNQKFGGVRVEFRSLALPAPPDCLDGKRRSVMIRSDTDPSYILSQVVDSGRIRPPQFLADEVVNFDLFGLSLGAPCLFIVPEQAKFFFLGIHRNNRFSPFQTALGLSVDILKLGFRSG